MGRFAFSAACVGLSLLINSWSSVWLYGTERAFEAKVDKLLDRFLRRSFRWNSEYTVVQNAFARRPSEADEDVTLVTQCSVDNLHHLIRMAGIWRGPMSIAVLAPKKDFMKVLIGCYWLTKCFPKSFEQATFHIACPFDKPTNSASYFSATELPELPTRKNPNFCKRVVSILRGFQHGRNYQHIGILYPHNTLRNVALGAITTKYTLVLDVDTFPSVNLREDFLRFASSREFIGLRSTVKKVFVIPAFEVKTGVPIPRKKFELIKHYKQQRVRPFHEETCPQCHKAERTDEWLAIPESTGLSVAYEIGWEQAFEPFVISERNVIRFDERFKQYGFDRISQVCELHVAGYQFYVLNNAFVCHDGFKRRNRFHATKDSENRRNFRLYTDEFIPELSLKYPKSLRSCKDAGTRKGRAKAKFLPRLN